MKANQTTIKKMGKRTYTLKELAQRDFGVLPKTLTEATSPHFSLANIQEDLLDDDLDKVENKPAATSSIKEASGTKAKNQQAIKAPPPNTHLVLPIKLLTNLIEKEIATTAKHLALEVAELQAWIDLQVLVPKQTLLALLRLARANNLDPLKEEVALALYEDERWQAYITVEGYSKILNNHPAFDGITFAQSPEHTNDIPLWMECTIYRKDRSHPIVIREYFEEVKGEQAIWQKMPRRMLRHRVMKQCARLAMT
ncbi:recombinase RecT [Polynucleobacter sp. IMCC 30228]|uniref:recombinase RecT n=1 Tax=Polynucleobacter sp. IMCC 30228 TaxID=2781011 RepID=UPI001F3138FA|nr:recombinase RecT [Polynucleobacter sp. IMCC 30228]MCE7527868.1 recombinase RecT [Polynucleobacter sp. IMCC 30228]